MIAPLLFSMVSAITSMACGASSTDAAETKTAAHTQAPSLEIYPISHATAVLNWGGTLLYIDPVGGADAFSGQEPPDIMLVTDLHGDHYNAETLLALKKEGTVIVAPAAVKQQMPAELQAITQVLDNGATLELLEIGITAIPMYNLREEARKFHEKGRGNGYVLEKGGARVYFSGDTEDIPEMRALRNIDMAFVCMNLPYTMTVEQAADAVLAFKPRMVYPYHYRGNPEVSDVKRFAELVSSGDPEIKVVQLDWYPADPF